jgi:hypothetical protein
LYAPTIDGPADRTVTRGSVIAPIAFTIADDVIPVEELTVTAASSNQAVVQNADIVLGSPGSGAGAEEPDVAHVTDVRTDEPSLSADYALAPSSRLTIDAGAEPGLVGRAFGAVITFDERSDRADEPRHRGYRGGAQRRAGTDRRSLRRDDRVHASDRRRALDVQQRQRRVLVRRHQRDRDAAAVARFGVTPAAARAQAGVAQYAFGTADLP